MFGRFAYQASIWRQRAVEAYLSRKLDTHSQFAEDLVIDRLLTYAPTGFYVDIGANDPVHFNNTWRFYKRGWTGVNIEPTPSLFESIKTNRPRDINLNIGIGAADTSMPFYVLSTHTLSTFDKTTADHAVRDGFTLKDTVSVPVRPLAAVLGEHAADRKIDFMSIDVEGFEIAVLNSNDWERFRPRLVMLEVNRAEDEIQAFMAAHGYIDVFMNGLNKIYLDAPQAYSA